MSSFDEKLYTKICNIIAKFLTLTFVKKLLKHFVNNLLRFSSFAIQIYYYCITKRISKNILSTYQTIPSNLTDV